MDQPDTARMRDRLAEHCSRGEYVLHSARMVGDEDDYSIWRMSRLAWREEVAAVLVESLPEEASVRFLTICASPMDSSGGWKRVYEAELRTVNEGLALLGDLAESLQRPREAAMVAD
jgi:hypothetical protein